MTGFDGYWLGLFALWGVLIFGHLGFELLMDKIDERNARRRRKGNGDDDPD